MIRFDTRCNTCKVIRQEEARGESKLMKRLFKSRAFVRGGEPVSKIADDYLGVKPLGNNHRAVHNSMTKHCRLHQSMSDEELVESRLKWTAQKTQAKQIRDAMKHDKVRERIMELGMEKIESGEVKLNSATVLGAANKQADLEQKEKDRGLALMQMVAQFQSGELQRERPDVIDGTIAE